MYKRIIRPLLFLLSPEAIHHLLIHGVKIFFKIPGLSFLVKKRCTLNDKRLERDFLGLKFSSPIGLAAGFDKNAQVFNEFSNFGFSFIEIGSVTPKAQPGNQKPRSFRLVKDQALINRMGINNDGVHEVVKRLKKRNSKVVIGGNISKNTLTPNENAVDDYEYCFRELYDVVDYFVINVSCPNVSKMKELQDKDSLIGILDRLMKVRSEKSIRKPVLLKIAPDLNFEQLDDVIEVVRITGTDGIVATNTTLSREGLITDKATVETIGNGGLSGKPLTDRSTEIIRYLSEKSSYSIPIIGSGGIMAPADAIDKLNAGATLIQLYTGFIYNGPMFAKKINRHLLKHYFKI
jgi:dihydroorotate dehydrogenase